MSARILLVDDEKEIRELFKSFLEDEDFIIDEAENGQEAFNMVVNERYDLYVTDVFMPEMNGVEFMKILKMLDPDAVVIIVTGYDNMEYTRQALDYGAFRFLTKPVKMSEFRSVINLGLAERKKLSHSSPAEKLQRMKEKLNTNIELRERLFRKLQNFLLNMEKIQPSYIEIGGPGSKEKIWGKFFSSFKPIPLDNSFTQDEINIMILSILSNSQIDTLLEQKKIKSNFEFKAGETLYRYRLFIYFEMDELVIGIKTTRRSIINLEQMKFNNNVLNKLTFKNDNSGLVIVCGPAGSGKSSLVDAIINLNNTYLSGNIFVLTDSLEYIHESKNSMVRHQEIFRDVNSVTEALDNCLDYNPNMIVIQDIVSAEILESALKLVDAGCLVVATLRSKGVIEAIYKLLSFYPPESQELMKRHLARSLGAIVCQQLLPTSQNKMFPVKEILLNNDQISQIVGSGNIDEVYEIIQRSKKQGMQTLEQDLVAAVRSGLISTEFAIEQANKQKLIKDMLQYS
ncbi:MAG: ATPase, T2SS/T4P/T4SS family [Sphaerochaetaceae bacterium]